MINRLPVVAVPEHYTLHFSIDFEPFLFSGTMEAALCITESVHTLRMHCEKLAIAECTMERDGSRVPISCTTVDGELHLTGNEAFAPGHYLLRLQFSGTLSDDLSGLYRSQYTDADDAVSYLATTQFEAPYARRAFPCFDEPAFKATFTVSIDIPAAMTGISNMPVTAEILSGDRKTVQFATTPSMSTYLLYIGAGHFDYIESIRGDRVVRVYGINGKSKQGAYALTFASDALEYFEQYTGIPYPLPKLDLIAIPDFAAGAMENWGAITFREVLLYVDKNDTSLAAKKRVAEVIAHELWHQWSGNLVTMRWWDDLWLNEAFATYNAYRAVDHFHPEWHIWNDFLGADTSRAFDMDMLSSTHPVFVPVETPNEIEEIFDSISYGKGGSILKMIEHFIGAEAFRKGVSSYLSAFAYGNATADDLWDTFDACSDQPVKDMLVYWIRTPGFPLLSVTSRPTGSEIRQQRFLTPAQTDDAVWPLPLTWTDGGSHSRLLMESRMSHIEHGDAVVKFNAQQTGFYRVIYTKEQYAHLSTAIRDNRLETHDRWGLISDLRAGVLAGYADISDLLELMDAYSAEKEWFVLSEINGTCGSIALHLALPDRGRSLFHRYCAPYSSCLERLGWQPSTTDTPEEIQLRSLAIDFLISSGDASINSNARGIVTSYLNGAAIDPNIRNACLSAAAAANDDGMFEELRHAYEKNRGDEEKLALLRTLAGFDDRRLIGSFLDYALTDAVRLQDLRTVFARVAMNPGTPEMFYAWTQKNCSTLTRLHDSYFVFMGLLQALIVTAPDTKTLDDIAAFLEKNTDGFASTKATAFEKARLYIGFRERERERVPAML